MHTQAHTHLFTEKKKNTHAKTFCLTSEASFSSMSPSGEPSPPAVHGQRGMGKAYRLGLVKQDDGGMPIVEYIVKYKTVSNSQLHISRHHTGRSLPCVNVKTRDLDRDRDSGIILIQLSLLNQNKGAVPL